MSEIERGGVTYDFCNTCGGIFFDYGEMLAIAAMDSFPETDSARAGMPKPEIT